MNSKQSIKIWSRVLTEACEGKPAAEQKKAVKRLEEILKAKKKGYLLPVIAANAFGEIENKSKFDIVMAHPQSPELVEKLKKKIAKRFGSGADAKVAVDPKLIGGFVAKSSQYLLDASVKNHLQQLKKIYEQ
jgi:F0F1-type ATP synthase delta subunit